MPIAAYDGPQATTKLTLPAFLKVLNAADIPMSEAMSVAAKIFKTHNTPAELSTLTERTLGSLKIDNKEQRKRILTAIKNAGWKVTPKVSKNLTPAPVAGPSNLSPRKKRKRHDELDYDPITNSDAEDRSGFDFDENLNENSLAAKSVVVNRAPVMTAWATIVAERLGFKRTEALSLASVYTEMNASSKGVSLGIYDKGKNADYDAGSSQPYVEIMARRPVLKTETGEWRGVVKGGAVSPSTAYGYMQRSFRYTIGSVIGSMRLLAASYEPDELNRKGFGLYAEFRPASGGWGERSEMKMDTVLGLRRDGGRVEDGQMT